jgi:hypothetical protein
LYKLSIHIRNPKARSNYSKASTFKAIDKDTGVDLVSQYEFFDIKHIRDVFTELRNELPKDIRDDKANDPLIERLGKANSRRRQQFMYWEKHRDKLAAESMVEEAAVADRYKIDSAERSKPPRGGAIYVNDAQSPELKVEQSMVTRSVLTATTATLFLPPVVSDEGESVVSAATTARGIDGKGVNLPGPPKEVQNGKDFECPYCFTICPAKYQHERNWR